MDDVYCCAQLRANVVDDDVPLRYYPKYREFGVLVLDGGTSYIELEWCPFSGHRLPGSLRDEYFDRLDALGIDPLAGRDMPIEMLTDAWWRQPSVEG